MEYWKSGIAGDADDCAGVRAAAGALLNSHEGILGPVGRPGTIAVTQS